MSRRSIPTDRLRYVLPRVVIAQRPVEPRDAARLLDARDLSDRRFADLPELLDPGDLVVVNRTRVRAARLRGRRVPGGGAVEVLLLDKEPTGTWRALVHPARRMRPEFRLDLGPLVATVVERMPGDDAGEFRIVLEVADPAEGAEVEAVVEAVGEVPLPPYITVPLDDPERYQTVFARAPGSAAAPTAALHFTPRVLERLAERDIEVAEVELHVGLGTFRPIATDDAAAHRMHGERYRIPAETAEAVASARRRGGRVVAIGTTVVRTLETRAIPGGLVEPGEGVTELYLLPGDPIRVVDRLVTNFHVPGSTLVGLVAAFMGEDAWRRSYAHALARGYRFLSFGDAMLADRSTTSEAPR